ncbi:MAG: MOSC domain-containing protein [Bacteroidales bacterium]|nr:MOSC domain-containing protein [Bacteroidales bacterium]
MIRVLSVNISEKKGTVKQPVDSICLDEWGVKNDAHAGPWNRQVSLLAKESVDKFSKAAGREIRFGEFAENITTDGIILHETHPLDRFIIGETELEVTQIGKECHGDSCAIFREVGNCVMPKEGIFCRVIRPGIVRPGDPIIFIEKIYKAIVITLSDRASQGIYEDKSGPRTIAILNDFFTQQNWKSEITHHIIPDDENELKSLLQKAKSDKTDIVITTGGTGIGPRDITPEAVRSVIDKEIPGIMELIRIKYGMEKPNALLSRSVAGVAGSTLIYALPGSVKAVNEYMAEISKTLRHSVFMLHGIDSH